MERWGLPNLPGEIVYDILSRLPVKSLCRFKSVSKPWLALITHPHLVKSHLHQSMKSNTNQRLATTSPSSPSVYSVDYQAPDHTVAKLAMPGGECCGFVEIRGSINGVLLLDIEDDYHELCLWNPSIRRMYQKFARPVGGCCFIVYWLGYDAISDDFKVVAVANPLRNDAPTIVHVFSSKLSSWKSIGDFGYSICRNARGSVLNGAPHWFVRGNAGMCFLIVCFDVREEKFKEVPNPIDEVVDDDCFYLGVLGGWLCVVDNRRDSHSDVWVMKEYDVKESWTKLFVVPNVLGGEFFFQHLELMCFTKGGEVIMKLDRQKLVIYNPKQNRYKRIMIPQNCRPFDVALYVESLVSPHGCNDTRRYC